MTKEVPAAYHPASEPTKTNQQVEERNRKDNTDMRRTNIRWGAAVFVAVAMLAAQQAKATLSFTLNAANVPLTGPFGTVDVTLTSSTTADVTLTALDSYSFGDGSTLGLNLANTAVTFALDKLTGRPGGSTPSIANTGSSGNVDGWGNFNYQINLDDGFGSSAILLKFTLTNPAGWTSENDILALNNKGYSVVGHVFSPDGAVTGFAVVPEPATMLSGFALLLLPFGASALRIIRKNREA